MPTIKKRTWETGRKSARGVSFQLRYMDKKGREHRRNFATYAEADAVRKTVEAEMDSGTHIPRSQSKTLDWVFDQYLSRKKKTTEAATYRSYAQVIDSHLRPFFAEHYPEVKLVDLDQDAVEDLKDHMLDTTRDKTAANAIRQLRMVLAYAIKRRWIGINVAMHVSTDERRRKRHRFTIPTRDEINLLLDNANEKFRPMLATLIFSGMRLSELRGLYWRDIDLEEGFIEIRQRADETGTIGAVKSEAAHRQIPIGSFLQNTLREWRAVWEKDYAAFKTDLVFPSARGTVLNASNIHQNWWRPLLLESSLVDDEGHSLFRLHDMRHWHASWLIARRVNAKRIQTRLGHADIQTTFDSYGHLMHEDDIGDETEAENTVISLPIKATA